MKTPNAGTHEARKINRCQKKVDVLRIRGGREDKSKISDSYFYLEDGLLPSDFDDSIILHKDVYKEIFGTTRAKVSNSKKLLSVVKVEYNGKSIYRAYRAKSVMTKNKAALTYSSMRLLSDELDEI